MYVLGTFSVYKGLDGMLSNRKKQVSILIMWWFEFLVFGIVIEEIVLNPKSIKLLI